MEVDLQVLELPAPVSTWALGVSVSLLRPLEAPAGPGGQARAELRDLRRLNFQLHPGEEGVQGAAG